MGRLFRLSFFLLFLAVVLTAGAGHATVTFYTSEPAFSAAASPVLLETFETFSPKDTPLSSFTLHGVTYTGYAGTPLANVLVASPGYINFGAGVGTTTSSILIANGDEDFTAAFSTPYYAVGFDTYLNGLGPATANFYGAHGLLGYYTYPGSANDKEYLGIVSTEPIFSLRWTSTLGGRLNTGIDNISVSSVPVPGAILLFAPGLLGLAAIRRRFKR